MTNLTYQVEIKSDCETVWRALTDPALYRKWATAFSANSQFVGNWVEGEYIDFFDPGFGGTRAVLEAVVRPQRIRARHIGVVRSDGTIDTDSDTAKQWIGAIEAYDLRIIETGTRLVVEISCHEDWSEMFETSWAKALPLLKALCESP